MKERKILTILGARPQFVKAAVVSRAIGAIPSLREVIVHTGQHYHEKMSEVFFNEMGIPRPQHMLAVGSGSHGAQTGRMLEAIEHVLVSEMPDWVLIYGDTNSTLAGALAAAKLRLPIAHVEAGLRSFNRDMPEEINRVVADHVSDLLLTPTAVASQQLRQEGIASSKIHEVGDVMLDSVLHYRERARISSRILANLKVEERGFVLATIHRPSNTDDLQVLRQLLDVLADLSERLPVVFPVHPRTRNVIDQQGWKFDKSLNFRLVDPVGYLDMLRLESAAALIITDSGGVQKEAFFCRTPCVTLREETEWRETVTSGWNRLACPRDREAILLAISAGLGSQGGAVSPYGDGSAAIKIAGLLAGHSSR